MSIMPKGDALRKAAQWISDERQEDPSKTLAKTIEAACLKFNLSPMDALHLERWIHENQKTG